MFVVELGRVSFLASYFPALFLLVLCLRVCYFVHLPDMGEVKPCARGACVQFVETLRCICMTVFV